MREGTLFFNAETGRYDVRFDDGETLGGLHCGDSFNAHYNGKWVSTRIEYNHMSKEWYISDNNLRYQRIDSLKVRIRQ